MKEYKSFFKTVNGNEGSKCHYNTRLDTYGCGCQHDCSYCYAKSLLDFRKLEMGGERLNLKSGNISEFIQGILISFKDAAQKSNIMLSIECSNPRFLYNIFIVCHLAKLLYI